MIKATLITAKALVSPMRSARAAMAPPGESDYVMVPLPLEPDATWIVVYERPENYNGEGTAAAYADGPVEWMPADKFKEALAKTEKAVQSVKAPK